MREKKDYFLWTHSGEPPVVKKWTSRLVAEKSLGEKIFSAWLALLKSNQLRKTYWTPWARICNYVRNQAKFISSLIRWEDVSWESFYRLKAKENFGKIHV